MNNKIVCECCGSTDVKLVLYIDYNNLTDKNISMKDFLKDFVGIDDKNLNGRSEFGLGSHWCENCLAEKDLLYKRADEPTEVTNKDTVLYLTKETTETY